MKYLLVGYLASSLIISEHSDKEACEGRAVTLRESKAVVTCVQAPQASSGYMSSSGVMCCSGALCGPCR